MNRNTFVSILAIVFLILAILGFALAFNNVITFFIASLAPKL